MAESSLRNVRPRKGFFQWLEVAGLYSVAVLTEGWTAVTFAIALLVVCAIGIGASLLMTQASNRSALWNMFFGGVVAFGVLVGAVLIAWLLARAAFS